jgi:undecaprenyl-diphosphatase
MSDYLHYILLGLVQGLAEFLPVSSSAHLILLPFITGAADQGLAIDIAAHVGTLSAVIWYFRKDLKQMVVSWHASGFSFTDEPSRYMWYLLVATIPVALIGLLAAGMIENYLRSPLVIAGTTIIFGILLWWADMSGKRPRITPSLMWKDVIIISLFQVLALIPGVSRSGITITAGLLLGLDRITASRFSFLLSIPVIALAGGYMTYKLALTTVEVNWLAAGIVTVVSALIAVFTIHFFLRFLEKTGMLPYVIYRFILGGVLLYLYL